MHELMVWEVEGLPVWRVWRREREGGRERGGVWRVGVVVGVVVGEERGGRAN